MNWVVVIWSAASGACLVLSGMHFTVWFRDRRAWASLVFAITTLTVIGAGVCEVGMMMSETPAEFGRHLQNLQLWGFLAILGTIVFIRLHLGTGRLWLGAATVGVRLASLVVNYAVPPNINYREIRTLQSIPFLGEKVAVVGDATINPLMWLTQTTFLLWFAFVVDAAITLWRRGDAEERRRALVIGGGMSLFILLGMSHTVLALNRLIDSPTLPSIAFILMTTAMSYELGRDVLRASRLAHDLRESERRLSLAASAARVALWESNARDNRLWLSSEGRALFPLGPAEKPGFDRFTSLIHPDDRNRVLEEVRLAMATLDSFSTEHRLLFPDGELRWIASSGAAEKDAATGATVLRGVSLDITERRHAETELASQREQLSHTLRLATVNQMASSLAHELNQPLTAMVSNAGAARRLLAKGTVDPAIISEILEDISSDGHRAGEVIRGIRGMARRDGGDRTVEDLNGLVGAVRRLAAPEAASRDCLLVEELAPDLPPVMVNAVQIQQVLLNLIVNAFDAVAMPGATDRKVFVRTEAGGGTVRVSVRDTGPGLPAEGAEKLFEQYFTTKSDGLGLGLVIARGLVEAHGGSLAAENAEGGGACFHFLLPAVKEGAA